MALLSGVFRTFVRDLAIPMGIEMARVATPRLAEVALEVMRRRLAGLGNRAEVSRLRAAIRTRYIVAPSSYYRSTGPVVRRSLHDIFHRLRGMLVRSEGVDGPKVLMLSPLEALILKERFRELLVEEDVRYALARTPLLGEIDQIVVSQSVARPLTIRLVGKQGGPVAGARVVLFTDVARQRGYEGYSDAQGRLTLRLRKADTRFERVTVLPHAGFWSRVWKQVTVSPEYDLCLQLSPLCADGFDWGHRSTEAPTIQPAYAGQGITIAVIDSGIAPHPSLRVTAGKNFLVGEDPEAWHQDMDGHGTHCAGVIAAVHRAASMWGYVPRSTLYALRVFGADAGGGYASDIRDAIQWAIRQGCDVINMSLGSQVTSSFLRMALEEATDAGVLCVAAAGNARGAVDFPARLTDVVAVAALGKVGTYPRDSLHREAQSRIRSADAGYFLAAFSNRGEEIDLCAPGVAITSTLPDHAFGAWDGTSMSCPHIAGIAALALQTSPTLLQARRDAERTVMWRDRLRSLCVDLGMARSYQGAGLPLLRKLPHA